MNDLTRDRENSAGVEGTPEASGRNRFALWMLAGVPILLLVFLAAICAGWLYRSMNAHSRPHGHDDITFDIAPGGDMMVFNAIGEGGFDLYILRLDDLSVLRIAATPEYETTPSFTPDGKSVVYTAGVPGDRADHIFICALDGSGVRQLTRADANDSSPRVSPDGSLIVFDRDKTYQWGGLGGNWGAGGVICVVGIDGESGRQLTLDGTFACRPWFLPDGKSVAYWTQAGIYAVQVDGSDSPRLLANLGGPHEVAPSHDGKAFAYTRGEYSASQELLFANSDGSGERRIAPNLGSYYRPQFSPAGDCLYFCEEEWPDGPTGTPRFSLWRIDPDGGNLRKIAGRQIFDDPLRWRPESNSH